MALYPGARQQLIPAGSNDPAITPIGVILHVDGGNVGNLHDYFDGPSGGIESHFHVPKVGTPYQYRDTSREADANYHGNSFLQNGKRFGFISVETQGLASGEWNANQIAEIKKLLLWAHETHEIPLRRCPAWNQPGIGYHVMFGAPGPWTPHAKVCPGPDKVKQFTEVLVPWFAHATPPTNPTEPEDDMPYTEEQLRALTQAELEEYGARLWANPGGTGAKFIRDTKASIAALTTQVAGLSAAVKALATQQGIDPAQVEAAVEDAVGRALADLKITLAVQDGGQ
jgi:hypothetical protein